MTWRARNAGLVRALALKATLESGRRWTLAQLAERFSVTTRTVRRDIAALEAAGVAVCHEWAETQGRDRGRWWVLTETRKAG